MRILMAPVDYYGYNRGETFRYMERIKRYIEAAEKVLSPFEIEGRGIIELKLLLISL